MPHRTVRRQLTTQNIESEPATFVFKLRLVRERRRTERLSEIFSLNQPRVGIYRADRSHRKHYAATLGQKCLRKGQRPMFVRVPVTVKTTETRRGQRLVDGSVFSDPRIAAEPLLQRTARVFPGTPDPAGLYNGVHCRDEPDRRLV